MEIKTAKTQTKKIEKRKLPKKEIKEKTEKEVGKVLIDKEIKTSNLKPEKYFEVVGRRKTSIARVRLFTQGGKEIFINNKSLEQYFPSYILRQVILSPLEIMGCLDKFKIQVLLKGGGFSSQAEAVRHGISRGLVLFNPDFRKRLKKAGFLTRDPRMRERKKPGLKRARKAPQWAKR